MMSKCITRRRANKQRVSVLIPLLALLAAGLLSRAIALPDDRRQPINLEADSANFDQRTGVSEYRGNVLLSQGSLRLAADNAKVFINDGSFRRMEADGSPTQFSYQPEASKPPIEGSGRRVTYNVKTGIVIVSGNAYFIQGGDKFSGETIEYNLIKDTISARGDGKTGRIKITLQPESGR